VEVENAELRPLSEFRRDLPTLIEELQDGRREKVVITKHGQLEAVVISVPRYEELTSG
jgi:prevent-host-death family protein